MREIKFRAWDKRNNKWFHGDLFFMSNNGFYPDFRELEDGNSLFDYEYKLMQFTGLLDKNGIPIYEGDVVEMFNRKDFRAEVIHVAPSFCLKWFEKKIISIKQLSKGIEPLPWNMHIIAEVIGNKFEDGDLLENPKS